MALYTFVLEHGGGTFISQVASSDVQQAFASWIERMRAELASDGISMSVWKAFADADGEDLVAVNGLKGVWCASAIVDEVLALLNVISTNANGV